MADHTHEELDTFKQTLRQCAAMADAELATINLARGTETSLI